MGYNPQRKAEDLFWGTFIVVVACLGAIYLMAWAQVHDKSLQDACQRNVHCTDSLDAYINRNKAP